MKSDAEKRLTERGVRIEEIDVSDPAARQYLTANTDILAYVMVAPLENGGFETWTQLRPELPDEYRESFCVWFENSLVRLFDIGPDVDGWQRRELDGAFQLWVRAVDLDPSLADL